MSNFSYIFEINRFNGIRTHAIPVNFHDILVNNQIVAITCIDDRDITFMFKDIRSDTVLTSLLMYSNKVLTGVI